MDVEYKSWAFDSNNTTVIINDSTQEINRSNDSSSHSHRSQDSGFSDSDVHVLDQKSSPTTSEKNLSTSFKQKSPPNKHSIFENFQRNESSRLSCIPAPFHFTPKRHSNIKTNPHLLTSAAPISFPCTSTPKPLSALNQSILQPPVRTWLENLTDSFEMEITVSLQSSPILSRLLQEVNELSNELIETIQSLIKHMNSIQEMFDSIRSNDSSVTLKQLVGNITEFVLIINLASNRTIVDHKKRDKLLEACDMLLKEAQNHDRNENDEYSFFKIALKDMFSVYSVIASEATKFHIQVQFNKL